MPTQTEPGRRGLLGLKLPGLVGRDARKADEKEARAIQARLLPSETPQIKGFQIACAWGPSAEVSGDYFDVFELGGDRIALCIADVSGRGLAAATLMSQLHDAVRGFAPGAASAAELCTTVNQALCGSGAQTRFATMFYAILEPGEARLRYENAGHCLPLLMRGDGGIEFPASFSGVIGIFSHWLYQNQEIQLRSGDCLLLITDGILLAENRRHEEFGYKRLIEVVENGRAGGAAALSQEILAAVTKFCGGNLRDEASLVVVMVD